MKTRVGVAIQGGVVPAGAFAAGVLNGLLDRKAFEHQQYDICAFSGTSAGGAIATLCWSHMRHGKRNIDGLGDDLIKQWTYLQWPRHLAVFPLWFPWTGSMLAEFDAFTMKSTLWRKFVVERARTPFLRWIMTKWHQDCIFDALNDSSDDSSALNDSSATTNRLGLALGAADVLRGKIKIFREDDLSLAAVLACGSLYEMGGVTTIVAPPHDGTYLDGAWADNPPINELLDYGLDEIWLIQCFRKTMPTIPHTPAERTERKHELWQNSLVEHELEFVSFVNEWATYINGRIIEEITNSGIIDEIKRRRELRNEIESVPTEGSSDDVPEAPLLYQNGEWTTPNVVKDHLRRNYMVDGKLIGDFSRWFDEENDLNPKHYKEVTVKKIEIGMPRELGSASINAPWFIRNMMRLGYEQALQFADNGFKDKPFPELRPAGWAKIPSPFNDLLYGIKPPSPPKPKPFIKGPIGDALELACDFCPRRAISTAGELFLDVLPKTVQATLKEMDTAICDFCPKTQMAKLATEAEGSLRRLPAVLH